MLSELLCFIQIKWKEEREHMIEFIQRGLNSYGTQRFIDAILGHIKISLIPFVICLVIGIPLGWLCARSRLVSKWIMSFAQFMKVIPTLAIMILLLQVLGSGITIPIIVLTILGLPPVMVNTCLGIRNIEPKTIEAARGIGMDNLTILRKIQIPLALPMILVGVRTTGVQIISCATLAYYIGGGGMGAPIRYGLSMHLNELLVISSAVVALMTAMLDLGFSAVQKWADEKYTV